MAISENVVEYPQVPRLTIIDYTLDLPTTLRDPLTTSMLLLWSIEIGKMDPVLRVPVM